MAAKLEFGGNLQPGEGLGGFKAYNIILGLYRDTGEENGNPKPLSP